MTSLQTFMSMKTMANGNVSIKPPWVDNVYKSQRKFKQWWKEHYPIVEAFNQYRIWNEWNNLLWYTGEILEFMDNVRSYSDWRGFKNGQRRTLPFWINHISDLIDKRATDLSSLKANFETTPPPDNISEKTRMSSRLVRPFLNNIKLFNNLDLLFDENERSTALYGNGFTTIDWEDKVGDRVLYDAKGRPLKEVKWEGEVVVKQQFPWYFLPFPARIAFSSPVCIQIFDILHVELARQKYGNNDIQPDGRSNLFSFASPFDADILQDEVVIYRTIVRPNEFMPEGMMMYNTFDGTILKDKSKINKYPYSHNQFPWEQHTDVIAHGKPFAYSIMNELKPCQWTYNLIGGMIKKSIFLTAHPKWMMTKGACNIQALGNGITVVQHKAGQRPELARYDVVGADTTNFREDVKTTMQRRAGSHGLSNGEIPPNTRSGIQISRLQAIEQKNKSYNMGKRNDYMKRVLLKSASVAGDYYPTQSYEHLERTLGKTLAQNIGVLKDTKIFTQTVLNIQNSAGFSDDLAGRVEEVAFMREKLPGLVKPEQEADIIGLRSSQKFYDITTAALRMAEKENEDFNDGKDVLPPLIEQDHFQHWQTHVMDMQTPEYAMLPKQLQLAKLKHLGMHEMFMEKLMNSPTGMLLKQKIVTLERFPLVFRMNTDISAIENEVEMEKQQAQMASAAPSPIPGSTPTQ